MAIMVYAAFTFRTFRKSSRKIIRLVLLSLFIGAPILFAFTIFYSNLLPLPKNLLPYLFGGTFVAATSMVCFEYLLRLLERKKSARTRSGS
jgi:drug/metabolite transporter (DMT)-like permease